jgi:membrane-associated phospholipid phosphatase
MIRRWLGVVVSLAGLALSGAVLADALGGLTTLPPKAGERLSDWLLRQPEREQQYLPGLAWCIPSEINAQGRLKSRLLTQLMLFDGARPAVEARTRMGDALRNAPVTGRVPVPEQDPRWLEAHPDKDPVLDYDHQLYLTRRPQRVEILGDNVRPCQAPHTAGAESRSYLRACLGDAAERVDVAWLIQPDGRVELVQLNDWNARAQSEPAPGARIWAPARDSVWPTSFSAELATFLATQPFSQPFLGNDAAPQLAMESVLTLPKQQDFPLTAGDWGLIGNLQTPSARMAPRGEMSASYSMAKPYQRFNVLMQPLDWVEAGFRYTSVSNRLYGPEIAGDRAYLDKSIDAKVRLVQETAYLPQVAVGFMDLGGTGLWASEYLVANKRFGNLDLSAGMVWGYLAGSGNISNPLSRVFGASFDQRTASTAATGGQVNFKRFFHGNTSLFAGLQYQTPWEGVIFKAELDGNDYRNEPQDNNQKRNSPINFGVVYRYHPNLDFSVGVERGNTLMLSMNFHGGLDTLAIPKLLDPKKVPVRAGRPETEPDWAKTAADLATQSGWKVLAIQRQPGEVSVEFEKLEGFYWKERIDQMVAVLHRDAPADIYRFRLRLKEYGMPLSERLVLRESWVNEHLRYQAAMAHFEAVAAAEPRGNLSGKTLWSNGESPFAAWLTPSYNQTLGGPNGGVLFQAGVGANLEWRWDDGTWLSGRGNLRLVDNYSGFVYDAPSKLPRVRTDMRHYLTESRLTLTNLQVNHVEALRNSQYLNFYGGLLEYMYAGVGAEWLYRPWYSPFAFGVDVNRVQQRDYAQDFGLRDYKVNTGHATLYWDTGWNQTHINLSVGQYLAGDKGATLEVSRRFQNGVAIGAWGTKTNVSAETFGEGSFDKGIFVRIPFDAMLPIKTSSFANINWQPLTRDGGARLIRTKTLYDLTDARDPKFAWFEAASPRVNLDKELAPDNGFSSLFGDLGDSAGGLVRDATSGDPTRALLYSGGLILGASLLDKPAADWANKHQSSRWNTLGKMSSATPLVLAGATGLFWWGAAGDVASDTAWTAIKSAALALGVGTATKYAVGRARPEAGLGEHHFSGFNQGAANSSFPSSHMSVSFALVTPFARKYDADWLYAVAGITSFGRMQQRQHFISDIVAGALLGYGVGSLLSDRFRNTSVGLTPDRHLMAQWRF